jgi:hypothetical protein
MEKDTKKNTFAQRATRLMFAVALVLALAVALVCIGWLCPRPGDAAGSARADIAELRAGVATAAQELERRLDARLDRIEGKIDALLRIAANPAPDFQPVPGSAGDATQGESR